MKTQLLVSALTVAVIGGAGFLYSQNSIAQPSSLADLNGDDCVDRADYTLLMTQIRSRGAYDAIYDLNEDGRVNRADGRTMVASFSLPRGAECPDAPTVVEEQSGISLQVPEELTVKQGGGFLIIGDESEALLGLPPTMSMVVYDTPAHFTSLDMEEALLQIAYLSGLESGDIISEAYTDNGLEIRARSLTGQHYFIYDQSSNKAVEFLSGEENIFSSEIFIQSLDSLRF